MTVAGKRPKRQRRRRRRMCAAFVSNPHAEQHGAKNRLWS